MRIASIIINAAIFLLTALLLIPCFYKDGRWDFKRGLQVFRYFTVLSNALCACSALAMAAAQIGGRVSPGALLFKYLGTVSVTVTLLTVLFFLGPTQGYKNLLSGRDFYMHLVGPIMAIGSFCLLEKRGMSLPEALLGLAPVVLYGIVYLYKVICAPEGKRWEDFYGFNRGGRWPVAFAGMLAGTLAVCLIYWRI